MGRGLRVGVITNDQGHALVDTAFARLSNLPTVEVTGGCFCCRYDDLNSRLDDLLLSAHPQVVFAESVGSCTDLVATVLKPLLEQGAGRLAPSSFSVFTDARLLLRRLRGQEMPFSQDVTYIFDKQIEEASMLVINKADLLTPQTLPEIKQKAASAFPDKTRLLQTSLTPEGVWHWVDWIQSPKASLPLNSLQIDYGRYAAGEAALAWLDQEVHLHLPPGTGKPHLESALQQFAAALAGRGAAIGHIKCIIRSENVEVKLSLPTLEEPGWQDRIPHLSGDWVHLLVNARAQISASELSALLQAALQAPGVQVILKEGASFHPGAPKPTHRIG